MPVCECTTCRTTSTYEDYDGEIKPGAIVSQVDLVRHRIAETKRQSRIAEAEQESDEAGTRIMLATLETPPPARDYLPVRNRDVTSDVGEVERTPVSHFCMLPTRRSN